MRSIVYEQPPNRYPCVLALQRIRTYLVFSCNPLSSIFSSAVDSVLGCKVAIKKLARPFQSAVHAKRTYRELRMLKHMNHENVRL